MMIRMQDGAIRQDVIVKFAAPMEDDLKGGVDACRIVVDIIKREVVFMQDDLDGAIQDCNIRQDVVMKASMRRNEDEDEASGGLTLIVPIFDKVQASDAVSYNQDIVIKYAAHIDCMLQEKKYEDFKTCRYRLQYS